MLPIKSNQNRSQVGNDCECGLQLSLECCMPHAERLESIDRITKSIPRYS